MLSVDSNGNIKLNKGDTFKIPLFIDISDSIFNSIRMPVKTSDKVVLDVLQGNQCCGKSLIHKEFTLADTNENFDILLSFDSSDTKCLCPGIYFYEIKFLRSVDGEEDKIVTIIPRRKFVIQ